MAPGPVRNKQERRRQFADLAIQGTNNSSIASKRSVEVVYYPKLQSNESSDGQETLEYFKHFVPKPLQRSPCINRGYWLRLHAIRSQLDEISAKVQGPVVVVNLGCGFDPLPFQLLDKRNVDSKNFRDRFTFLDVDYPELIDEKASIIAGNDELKEIVGEPIAHGKYHKYSLVACNLNYPDPFAKLVDSLDDKCTKVFIAEVSLAYMKPEQADQIIEVCSTATHSHFLMLEQLTPASSDDPFGHQMLKHFNKNRSPLQSVIKYQSVDSQTQRFNRLGFSHVNAGDMFQLWCSLNESTKSALQRVEPFDELEEFHLFAHHYIILHATNETFAFDKFPLLPVPSADDIDVLSLPVEYFEIANVRKFGASVLDPNKKQLLYFGGSCPQRTNEIISIGPDGDCEAVPFDKTTAPVARACHTFTLVNNDTAMVVGGRRNPWQPLSDTWMFNLSSHEWTRGPDLPEACYRHVTCLLKKNKLLILSGKTQSSDAALLLDIEQNRVESIPSQLPVLIAPAADNTSTRKGVLIGGGCANESDISDHIYIFTYDNDEDKNLKIVDAWQDPLFCRYGAQARFINDNQIVLAGGTGPFLFNARNMIVVLDIRSHTFKSIALPNPLPLLVGADLQFDPHSQELLLVGGGATCYGFGSVWNHGARIRLTEGKY
ncbi:ZYRO0C03344p [Zygosaccharomyces rouxii]|uniref:tRNA wybutosine-synthesizing protein 4 n=1 Tax=Zygosaccharomyces rouxii (strain ATCC 2623 / CBS 732 / NBRC 1130 / NCYC 568 / NRRL Y-229) TaxID=559307 RepID=C5DSV7_ZYGRC|nr:uncharacterized protein ZYRO0C03344g [Zygosaccharomyces rouxii]KAH9201942.1 S-adenosyl-L-methionine-dependent methyltransferase [Zygosaccharomyces rouxii]CAR26868.1 ZYRO0C03344p [Zygosaccharomyces rouxii]